MLGTVFVEVSDATREQIQFMRKGVVRNSDALSSVSELELQSNVRKMDVYKW